MRLTYVQFTWRGGRNRILYIRRLGSEEGKGFQERLRRKSVSLVIGTIYMCVCVRVYLVYSKIALQN